MTIPILLLNVVLHVFVFQASFAIIGTVRDTDGKVVPSIRVSLLDENYQIRRTVFADSSGRFKFSGLRSGVYIVRAEPIGTPYEEQIQRVEFQSISAGRGGRGPSAEEPFMVDLIVRRKKAQTASQPSGVDFAQTVPDAARVEYKRGMNSLKDNKSEEGIASLKKAIEIFPDYYLALESLGTEYVKREEFAAAVPVLKHAIEVNRRGFKSLYALGVAHLKLNHTEEAIQRLQEAARGDSNNPNIYMMLGLAYGYNRAFVEAETSFKKAYQLGGEQAAEAHFYLAGIYNKQGKYSDAARELELYLKEAKDLKDRARIVEMINKLKAKESTKD